MTTPRGLLIDPNTPGYYHLTSRCVQRSWLFGRHRKRDYSYRKKWLIERMAQLTPAFALEIHAFALMSNHFHLIVYVAPRAPVQWSDEDVVQRWFTICPPKDADGEIDRAQIEVLSETLMDDPLELDSIRTKLGSVSVFMKLLKQPIARRANMEDGCTGHFFEQRFYSAALLDDEALVAAMAYVDLNANRAGIADSLVDSEDTSIAMRLKEELGSQTDSLPPIWSGLPTPTIAPISRRMYVRYLEGLSKPSTKPKQRSNVARWRMRLAIIGHKQRAYGALSTLRAWIEKRGLQFRERPLV